MWIRIRNLIHRKWVYSEPYVRLRFELVFYSSYKGIEIGTDSHVVFMWEVTKEAGNVHLYNWHILVP